MKFWGPCVHACVHACIITSVLPSAQCASRLSPFRCPPRRQVTSCGSGFPNSAHFRSCREGTQVGLDSRSGNPKLVGKMGTTTPGPRGIHTAVGGVYYSQTSVRQGQLCTGTEGEERQNHQHGNCMTMSFESIQSRP